MDAGRAHVDDRCLARREVQLIEPDHQPAHEREPSEPVRSSVSPLEHARLAYYVQREHEEEDGDRQLEAGAEEAVVRVRGGRSRHSHRRNKKRKKRQS